MNINSITNNASVLAPQQSDNQELNTGKSGFDKLWDMVQGLNQTQVDANNKMEDVLTGKSDDTTGALMGLEKAQIQLQFATTLRDKLTQGYQQIINMQL